MGELWVVSVLAAVILLLLLIFILQNGQSVEISFLGLDGSLPLGVALLLAAISGILLVAIPGTGRIVQLRRTAKRRGKLAAATQRPPATEPARPSVESSRAPAEPGLSRPVAPPPDGPGVSPPG